MEDAVRKVFPLFSGGHQIYKSLDDMTEETNGALRQIQEKAEAHFNRSLQTILANAEMARREGPESARTYIMQTVDALIHPRVKTTISLFLEAALRLVVYNQCAHLAHLYRKVPGFEMATEQPRLVVAHYKSRLEWLILGTALETALSLFQGDTNYSLEDWLRIGVRLKFIATTFLADAESLPFSAKSDAHPLLNQCHNALRALEALLRTRGHQPPQGSTRFEAFVLRLLADDDNFIDGEWQDEAIQVQKILLLAEHSPLLPTKSSGQELPTSEPDEDSMELKARAEKKTKF
jgi:hypothetical protein